MIVSNVRHDSLSFGTNAWFFHCFFSVFDTWWSDVVCTGMYTIFVHTYIHACMEGKWKVWSNKRPVTWLLMASEIGGIDVCMLRIHSEAVGLKLMHSRLLESSSFKSIYFSCSQEQIKPKRSLIFGTRNLLLLAKSARDCRIFISRSIGRNFRHARALSFRAKWLKILQVVVLEKSMVNRVPQSSETCTFVCSSNLTEVISHHDLSFRIFNIDQCWILFVWLCLSSACNVSEAIWSTIPNLT